VWSVRTDGPETEGGGDEWHGAEWAIFSARFDHAH